MREKIEALMAEVASLSCKTEQEIEQARVRLLGKGTYHRSAPLGLPRSFHDLAMTCWNINGQLGRISNQK